MHTLKLIRCWSTFWFYYTTQSFWVWVYQHGTSWLSNICPLFFAKMLQICQIARASPVHSPLQITTQMFSRIQVWAMAGPLQNFNLLLVKPFFCWFGCMLWVVVVLKDEVPLHLQHSSRSLKVLCQYWLVFGAVHNSPHLEGFSSRLSSILEGHPVLGNITVAPYFLQLMMTVFTVFHGMSNALEIILYPSPDWYLLTMRSLWCFGSSLQTMAFAVRCD